MNKSEYLLVCLMEEAAEVQKAAAKALRFGLNNGSPATNTTNSQDLVSECCDLIAILGMAQDAGLLPGIDDIIDQAVLAKESKVSKYMEISRSCGTLSPRYIVSRRRKKNRRCTKK